MTYVIGIDLGTTNCTMAYAKKGEEGTIHSFLIPQITKAGMESALSFLPSFLYLPLEEEKTSKTLAISWNTQRSYCVGLHAKERGKDLSHRVVSSAKSWLCQSGLDRRDPFLPLNYEEKEGRLSPVAACSRYLEHLKEAWNESMTQAPFTDQMILITVPASFDPAARQLIQEAATLAGYPEVILLEEPQAAFYAWLYRHLETWREQLSVGDKVLVVDVGGGTTDFSLIQVEEEAGSLALRRQAVGSHLLLGGDNMDLALAYFVKERFAQSGHVVLDSQIPGLVQACCQAKEELLSENGKESIEVTLAGRGSRLIGGAITVTLNKQDVLSLLLEGFFPLVSPNSRPLEERRHGVQSIGLNYAKDPRISAQLAKFLSMTGEEETTQLEKFIVPTAVLFNGGVFKTTLLRKQILTQLDEFAQFFQLPKVKELPLADLDHGVSLGAVYYGMAREGQGIRIKSGTSRSYFIGVEKAAPAVPGIPPSLIALCIAPFGMEEGTEVFLKDKEFSLVIGEPASFRFFSHSAPSFSKDRVTLVGDEIKEWKSVLLELDPIETTLASKEDGGKLVRVKLRAKVTELGVLELWCDSIDGRSWKLEFETRKKN